MKTTCQICARDIKANTGIIAHHGYQRPQFMGWQTASCDGARQLPYEVSRDFIPVVIERYKMAAKNQEDMADDMLRNPEATITRRHYNAYTHESREEIFTKPADFNPYDAVNLGHRHFSFASYENEFVKVYQAHRSNQEEIKAAIVFLQDRFDKWVKVA